MTAPNHIALFAVSGQREFDCVEERPLLFGPLRRGPGIWHVCPTRGRSTDFAPIRCSTDEGIVLPGGVERRVPTCPECIALVTEIERQTP